jgi:cytosine/adenosine deaminase-related metal-dependent hydrolase
MLKYFSADWIFPVSSLPVKNGVIAVNSEGVIKEILNEESAVSLDVKISKYKGALIPGLINTHCHLELSHMLGKIPEHTGLVNFVQHIIKNRQGSDDEVLIAMQNADQEMQKNGIVAVGDISNTIISKTVKQDSPIHYHTFVEAMGFNPARAESIMDFSKGIQAQFEPLKASVVPHAPYSVSPELFKLINQNAEAENAFLSIHNQETTDENLFFENKTGGFLALYKFLGLDISFFNPTGKTSLQSWLTYIKKQKILLVHNTVSSKADVEFTRQTNSNLFWCLCPQANLYIENNLPDVDLLISENLKITLGTDSLASNHQLNILSEMKTLQQQKRIDFNELLKWATMNGAEFLGLTNLLGTLEVGKKPGLNLIQLSDDFIIESDQVVKII